MRDITTPPWRVARPIDLDKGEKDCAGLIVLMGPPRHGWLIADCRNPTLPEREQRANAALCAKAPLMAQALIDLEVAVGDLPASKVADTLYELITGALKSIGITPRDEADVG